MTNAYDELEKLAKQFRHDTGLTAPFKDVPATCVGDQRYDQTYRRQEFDKWLQSKSISSESLTSGTVSMSMTTTEFVKQIVKWIAENAEHESFWLNANPAWEVNAHELLDCISGITGISKEQIDEWCDEVTMSKEEA